MKVAQLMATIPDALPPEYADGADQAAEPGAADGLGVRQAPHDRPSSAPTGRANSPSSSITPAAAASLGQVHRAHGARRRASSPASCNIPTCSRRSRPISGSSTCCSPSTAAWTRRSTPARSPRRSARACARNSTTSARPSTSRSTAACSPTASAGPRAAAHGRSCRPSGC